jgi:hypothetical protein
MVLQGGSVSDMILGTIGSRASLGLRSPGEIVDSFVFVKILSDGWLWLLPPLPLAFAAAVFVWKRWWLGLVLCGYGFAGYIGFHSLSFGEVAGAGELARVVNLSFLALALVAPLTLALLLRNAPPRRTALVAALLVPLVVPSLFQPLLSIALDLPRAISLHDSAKPGLVYTPQITDPQVTIQLDAYREAYAEVSRLLPEDSVVLTQFPVSFVIATGIPAAYAPIEGVTLYPTHIYIPGPEYYDAIWRLDPAAWRATGANAVLYHVRMYDSLPPAARELLDGDGWFVRRYDDGLFFLFTPTEAFLQYGSEPTETLSSLPSLLPTADSLHISTDLPYGIGQALVRQLKEYPVTGLRPDHRAHLWISLNRPDSLSENEATWLLRRDAATRLYGTLPDSALWHWRSTGESVGVYPSGTIPAFAPRQLAAGQTLGLRASLDTLMLENEAAVSSTTQFQTLTLVLAGYPGSVVRLCSPSGCVQRDLGGMTWSVKMPLGADLFQFSIAAVQGELSVAGTLGYGATLTTERSPGVVTRSRMVDNTIEVDASYFNAQGWNRGDGIAWHVVRVGDNEGQSGHWWASHLIIDGERGDVRLTLDPAGTFSEHNFSGSERMHEVEALANGEYHLYLRFTVGPFGVVDTVPAARFAVHDGAITAFTALPQIARLSFGTEHREMFELER